MKAGEFLDRYGLAAFGPDIDEEKANGFLSDWSRLHPRGLAFAVGHLDFYLDSLLQKMAAVDDGRSRGFHLSEDEAAILDILLAAGSSFAARREGLTVRKG